VGKFIPSYVSFILKSHSENCIKIKIRWFLTKLQTKISWLLCYGLQCTTLTSTALHGKNIYLFPITLALRHWPPFTQLLAKTGWSNSSGSLPESRCFSSADRILQKLSTLLTSCSTLSRYSSAFNNISNQRLKMLYQTNMAAWIKMSLGMELGLDLGDFVLDRDPVVPSPKGGRTPQIFGPCLLWPNGWMDEADTWHGGRPQPRRVCVRWGHIPLQKRQIPLPNFKGWGWKFRNWTGSGVHFLL